MNLYSIIKNHKMLMNWLKHEFLSFLLDNEPNELERDFFRHHMPPRKDFFLLKKFQISEEILNILFSKNIGISFMRFAR